MYANDIFTLPVNLAGLPGLSVPNGLSDGLPTGLQIIGPAFSENLLLELGHALEQAVGFDPVPAAPARGRRVSTVATGWEAVIGLEIHVQLATRTKMFCRCANHYGDPPNTNVCAVCLAHPGDAAGAEPAQAVRQAIRVGLALGCEIAERSKWDRKNYFYPDQPEGLPDQPVRPAAVRRRRRFHVPDPEGGFERRHRCARTSRRTPAR